MPRVFDSFEPGGPLTVLDVGAGASNTLGFLSTFRSRVYFADLYDSPLTLDPPEESTAQIADRFRAQLDLPEGTQLDVCLLWDYLHHLNLSVVRGFASALEPYLHPGTKAYTFGVLHSGQSMQLGSYGIERLDQISCRVDSSRSCPYAHSQQLLVDNFDCFVIKKATLLQEGRLEYLLHVG